jgi:hypothetical protein
MQWIGWDTCRLSKSQSRLPTMHTIAQRNTHRGTVRSGQMRRSWHRILQIGDGPLRATPVLPYHAPPLLSTSLVSLHLPSAIRLPVVPCRYRHRRHRLSNPIEELKAESPKAQSPLSPWQKGRLGSWRCSAACGLPRTRKLGLRSFRLVWRHLHAPPRISAAGTGWVPLSDQRSTSRWPFTRIATTAAETRASPQEGTGGYT